MHSESLRLPGLIKITPDVHQDSRGFFVQSYHEPTYRSMGITEAFPQDNHSKSSKHTVRGMHYQQAPGQAKLVRVVLGRIFDVAVDIRPGSATFGAWQGIILDDEKHEQLYIPNGFAHGFCVLSETAHVLYKTSSIYDHAMERGFAYNDPQVGIDWPTGTPLVSPRDEKAPTLQQVTASLPQVAGAL